MTEPFSPDVINSVGLLLDMTGVALLFKFGLPNDMTKPGNFQPLHVEVDLNPEDVRLWRRYKRLSRLGLTFLILGFALQIVSNHV